jgi:hypothetical protein
MYQDLKLGLPGSEFEIEIVLPIPVSNPGPVWTLAAFYLKPSFRKASRQHHAEQKC